MDHPKGFELQPETHEMVYDRLEEIDNRIRRLLLKDDPGELTEIIRIHAALAKRLKNIGPCLDIGLQSRLHEIHEQVLSTISEIQLKKLETIKRLRHVSDGKRLARAYGMNQGARNQEL